MELDLRGTLPREDLSCAAEKRVTMSMRDYSKLIGGVLLVIFGALLWTDSSLLPLDRLAHSYPWRAYPPIKSMSVFVRSWGMQDALLGSFPALVYVHQSLQAGHMPLWNPLEGLGLPASGSAGLGYLFPVHWLTYGLLHPLLAWHVELAAVMVIGSLSAYAVFRRTSGSAEGATLAATAWTFGGWCCAYLQLPSYAWSLCLFPLILLGIERANERGRLAHLQIGIGVGLTLTGGHPQMWPPALGLAALWALWRARARCPGIALAMGAGLGMGAYHLIPMIELLKLSERGSVPLEMVLSSLMLPREFLCMVFPTLMGQPSDNFYFGTFLARPVVNGREHCVFIGVLPLLLALLASARRHAPSSRPLAGLVLAGLVLAGAPPLYALMCWAIPPLQALTPTRFLPFTLFAVCLLCAQGWASLSSRPLSAREARGLIGVLAAFSLGALYYILPATMYKLGFPSHGFQSWLLAEAKTNFAAEPPHFEGDFGPVFVARVVDHFSFTSPAIACSFVVVIASALLIHKSIGGSLPFRPVLIVLGLDLAMYFAIMNTASPVSGYFAPNPDIAHLSQGTTLPADGAAPPWRVMGLGDGPDPNLLLVEGINNIESYESAQPGDTRRVFDALNRGFVTGHQAAFYVGHEKLEPGVLDLLGLSMIYNSPRKWEDKYGTPAYRGEGLVIADRSTALRAFLLDKYRTASESEAMTAMMLPAFEPRAEVLLDTPPSYSNPSVGAFEAVRPTEYSPQRVAFRVRSDRPTLLVLNDLHFPGWRVTVNGEPKPVLKAYGFARAVELAPGESQVVFGFTPTGFPYTPWIAVLSFLLCLAYGLRSRPAS